MSVVAECPRCEHPIEVSDLPTDASQVAYVTGQLVGHVFVLDTLMHDESFGHLKDEYDKRVARMIHTMSEWVHDLQDWSENGSQET